MQCRGVDQGRAARRPGTDHQGSKQGMGFGVFEPAQFQGIGFLVEGLTRA